jgi:GNAT superfamily N-acetyltransferase
VVAVEIVEFGPLTDAQRAELEAGEQNPFGTLGIELQWRPKHRHVMLRDDGHLLASTGLVTAQVSVAGGERIDVVGLGGVIVVPGHRGEGLARTIVEAALQRASQMTPALAILFCRDDVAGLYRKLGFALVEPPVHVLQPSGSAVIPQDTMWRALRDGAQWPAGPVLVHSLPF